MHFHQLARGLQPLTCIRRDRYIGCLFSMTGQLWRRRLNQTWK